LLDQWRSQCDYEELWGAYSAFCRRHNPCAALIERAANGYALIRDSKRRQRRLRVAEIATDRRSKIARLAPHFETIRAGRVKLPRDTHFFDDYVAEFAASKRTTFDQVDATTQYLEWIAKQPPLLVPPPRAVTVALNPSGPIMPDRNTSGHVLVTKRHR
jgi:phage terminase large subunit-like protein